MDLNDELVLANDRKLRDHRSHDELAHGKLAHDEVANDVLDFHGALARDGKCHAHHGHGYRGEQAHE